SERRADHQLAAKRMLIAANEGAAMLVDNSRGGFGRTVFVQQATVAQEPPTTPPDPAYRRLTPYMKEAESKIPAQMTLATEHYNRLVRMIQQGEKLKMMVNVDAQ